MGFKKRENDQGKYDYPPFGDKAFWDWQRKAAEKNARKREIGDQVRQFISDVVEKYRDNEYDPRRDLSWYLEQLGNDLRNEVHREESEARRAKIAKNGSGESSG